MEISIEQKEALLQRVAKGNETLYSEWLKSCSLVGNVNAWNIQMDRIERAFQKLDTLCIALKALGYNKCLYTDGRACWQEGKWFCFVCPVEHKEKQGELL